MEAREIARYGARLEELWRELRASLAGKDDAANPVEPDRAIGRLTRQDAMQAQQMALELKRRNKLRLEVKPETPVCVECAGGGRR